MDNNLHTAYIYVLTEILEAIQILIPNFDKQEKFTLNYFSDYLTIVSLAYGLSPNLILPKFFDFKVETIDLTHTFRATMGLYLGMAVLCVVGVFKSRQWRTATISNVFFMIGLASGRTISLVIDGIPSFYFLVGLVLELLLALWGIINLNKYQSTLN